VAASDRRVKAVVTQLPLISGSRTFEDLIPIAARAGLDLASDDSRYVTGTTITLDAGATLPFKLPNTG
jgi:NAD(P)-dependent dehydrogenase (short-subunit alcohol dehydrogenase family)